MRTTCNCPTTKLATFLFKDKRLSQASLELSSSRGLFGRLENERKRREKRENQTLNESCGLLFKMPKLLQVCLGLQNVCVCVCVCGGGGGGGGAYIAHPTTRKPNILANTRDKEVIRQNGVVWH